MRTNMKNAFNRMTKTDGFFFGKTQCSYRALYYMFLFIRILPSYSLGTFDICDVCRAISFIIRSLLSSFIDIDVLGYSILDQVQCKSS